MLGRYPATKQLDDAALAAYLAEIHDGDPRRHQGIGWLDPIAPPRGRHAPLDDRDRLHPAESLPRSLNAPPQVMERKRDGFVALGDVAGANLAARRSQPCSPRADAAGAAPLHPPRPRGAARRREGRGRGCWVHGAAARACSLPRANPGNRKEFIRRNGPYTLVMTAGGLNKLPYGNLPRRLLAWVTTEAVRTQRRELVLGRSNRRLHEKSWRVPR